MAEKAMQEPHLGAGVERPCQLEKVTSSYGIEPSTVPVLTSETDLCNLHIYLPNPKV